MRTRWLVLSMIAAVIATAALAYWDGRRRNQEALADFGEQQHAIAAAAAIALASHEADVLPALRGLEDDGVRALTIDAATHQARDLHGRLVELPGLAEAIARGDSMLRVSREDAPELGLPERTAMIGFAPLPSGGTVAIAASANRQRDRARASYVRLFWSIALATGLVATFGGIALARQRKQLQLAGELAVANVARAKDAELERMSRAATMAALGSGVAHELSTPLGVIVGRAEQLLARAHGDERVEKSAQTILDQADHMDRVVRGLLGLARGVPIALQEIQPRELVREAAQLVEHRFSSAGVQLLPAVAAGLPIVRCEPLLFKHALVNLLLNACDASHAGGSVRIEVEVAATDVAFVITDEGEGITEANAARAIQPFFTTKPAGQGTGLGLAIANEIASTHRGSLEIAPRQPRGTRACITIPAGVSHA